jgi:hypothetical protein
MKSHKKTKLLYGLTELEVATSLSVNFWRKQIKLGRLKTVRVSTRVLVSADEVARFISEASARSQPTSAAH